MASRVPTLLNQIRNEHRIFEASRVRLLGLLDDTVGQYPAAGGNNFSNAYLNEPANGYDMTQAEWAAYWPTLRAAITITQVNMGSLVKGLLTQS
jgi:hypothetical protein